MAFLHAQRVIQLIRQVASLHLGRAQTADACLSAAFGSAALGALAWTTGLPDGLTRSVCLGLAYVPLELVVALHVAFGNSEDCARRRAGLAACLGFTAFVSAIGAALAGTYLTALLSGQSLPFAIWNVHDTLVTHVLAVRPSQSFTDVFLVSAWALVLLGAVARRARIAWIAPVGGVFISIIHLVWYPPSSASESAEKMVSALVFSSLLLTAMGGVGAVTTLVTRAAVERVMLLLCSRGASGEPA